MPRWGLRAPMTVALLATLSGIFVTTQTPAEAQAVTFSVTPDAALTNLFAAYGGAKTGWAGGDGTRSFALPDGRTAWFFNDSEIRTIKPNGKASPITLVHNSVVVEDAQGDLVQTLFSTGATRRLAYINPSPYTSKAWLWPASGVVSNGTLYVMFSEEHGRRIFHQKWTGSSFVATFALPSLQMTGMYLISAKTINWTQSILANSDGFTYVYGMNGSQIYVARAPSSAPLNDQSQWSYFDGSGWSSQQTAAVSIGSGPNTEFSVSAVGSHYILVSMGNSQLFKGAVDAYVASSPTGPFSNGQEIYQTPLTAGRFKVYTYNAHVQPGLTTTSGGETTLVFSYDIDAAGIVGEPVAYRPRFLYLTVDGA